MERRVGKKQDQILLQKVTSGILQEGLIVRTEEVSKRNLEGDIASLERVRPTCLTTKITSRTVKKDLVMG
jgi:hypothetical protein